jgi:cytochrome c-type biogenesis protein CcmH
MSFTAFDHAMMARALQLDPQNPQARFMAGLLQIQNGRPDRAFPIWATLLAEGPENAPWIQPIRASITDLAWFAGQPDYTPPDPAAPGALPGPDAAAVAAAQEMTPAQRQEMIGNMVKGLETRLASQGGTPEEWARLIGALVVMGQDAHARDILAEARTRFAAMPEGLAVIEAAAKKASLQ